MNTPSTWATNVSAGLGAVSRATGPLSCACAGSGSGSGGGAALPTGGTPGQTLIWNGSAWVAGSPVAGVTAFRGVVVDASALSTMSSPKDGDVAVTSGDGHLHVYHGGSWTDIGPAGPVAGTAPSAATVVPVADAPTAVVGTSALYAREDHVHPTPVHQHMTAMPTLTPFAHTDVDAKAELAAATEIADDGVHLFTDGTVIRKGDYVQWSDGHNNYAWDYGRHGGSRMNANQVAVLHSNAGARPEGSMIAVAKSFLRSNFANRPTLLVYAAAGRTGSIQEWADDKGNVIAHLDTDGTFTINGHTFPTTSPVHQHTTAMPTLNPSRLDMTAAKAELAAATDIAADGVHQFTDGIVVRDGDHVSTYGAHNSFEWNYQHHAGEHSQDGGVVMVHRSNNGATGVPLSSHLAVGRSFINGGFASKFTTLQVQAATGRNGSIQEWLDDQGNVLAHLDTDGTFTIGGHTFPTTGSGTAAGSSVSPATVAPLQDAPTAAVGTSNDYARADHVHPNPIHLHNTDGPKGLPSGELLSTPSATVLAHLAKSDIAEDGLHQFKQGLILRDGHTLAFISPGGIMYRDLDSNTGFFFTADDAVGDGHTLHEIRPGAKPSDPPTMAAVVTSDELEKLKAELRTGLGGSITIT